MAAACVACNGSKASTPPTDSPEAELQKETVTITVDGKSYQLDADVAEKYSTYYLEKALKREEYIKNLKEPTNASSFGRKLQEEVWVVFHSDTQKEIAGRATVILYEKGIEISKDGKTWYYSLDHCRDLPKFFNLSAMESRLHPGVWEPAFVEADPTGTLTYRNIYTNKASVRETFTINGAQLENRGFRRGIDGMADLTISQKKY